MSFFFTFFLLSNFFLMRLPLCLCETKNKTKTFGNKNKTEKVDGEYKQKSATQTPSGHLSTTSEAEISCKPPTDERGLYASSKVSLTRFLGLTNFCKQIFLHNLQYLFSSQLTLRFFLLKFEIYISKSSGYYFQIFNPKFLKQVEKNFTNIVNTLLLLSSVTHPKYEK